MSDYKPIMKSKEWSSKTRLATDTTLKVPMSTVAQIFCKWKKFGTTEVLPKFVFLANLSYRDRKASLMYGGDQEPDNSSDRASALVCGETRTFQKDNYFCDKELGPIVGEMVFCQEDSLVLFLTLCPEHFQWVVNVA